MCLSLKFILSKFEIRDSRDFFQTNNDFRSITDSSILASSYIRIKASKEKRYTTTKVLLVSLLHTFEYCASFILFLDLLVLYIRLQILF